MDQSVCGRFSMNQINQGEWCLFFNNENIFVILNMLNDGNRISKPTKSDKVTSEKVTSLLKGEHVEV